MDDPDLETRLRILEISNRVLQLELRYSQKMILSIAEVLGAPEIRDHFVKERANMLQRILLKVEDRDPGVAAHVLEMFEDNLDD